MGSLEELAKEDIELQAVERLINLCNETGRIVK
jgi:hypothetical protein